jgi:predicted transcriptional regulator
VTAYFRDYNDRRNTNPTDLPRLRRQILKLLKKKGPLRASAIETALLEGSNHAAIARAIRYAKEDGLIVREKCAWRIK